MTTPLLPLHPAPYPTESLIGYVLRLSETNGYASPWNLYQLAGMRQNETRTTGIRVEKLAMIANHSSPQLEKLAFSPSTAHPRWARLLGHPIVPTDIEITKPKLCPQCVTEKGFVEAHWHLEIMVACPVHRCMALSACPKCGNALSWFRPGLLECKCGGRRQGTSSRALMRRLREKDVKILFVSSTRRGGPQPFISVSDINAIESGPDPRGCRSKRERRTGDRHAQTSLPHTPKFNQLVQTV